MKKIKILIILATIILSIGMGIYVYKWEYRKPLFEVDFFSLNRGRAVFIRTPENKTILIGGGQNSEVIRELTKVMPFYRKKIDYVVIPSATPAQIGGLIEIVDRYDIGEIFKSKYMATSTVLTQLMKNIRKKKIHIEEVERGDEMDIGSLHVEVLFPNEDFKFNKSSLPELGLSITYDKTGVFLIGNLSKTIQKDILKSLDIMTTQNLLEFYNSAAPAKVLDELVEELKPKFIFSTKEKGSSWVSDGKVWNKYEEF
ncbi:MAG: hypothetical protein Q7S72_00280 [Candidatus Taylorbacteria bacterium]|nr:hypothetical protein [Candidatus Taylorbacteria bacterium]